MEKRIIFTTLRYAAQGAAGARFFVPGMFSRRQLMRVLAKWFVHGPGLMLLSGGAAVFDRNVAE